MPLPGERALVYDGSTFKDDISTPWLQQYKPATVVKWYGQLAEYYPISESTLGPYPELYDVIFDERPTKVSRGHFTASTPETIRKEIQEGKYRPGYGEALLEKAQNVL